MNAVHSDARLRWIEESGQELLFLDLHDMPANEGLRVLDGIPKFLEGRAPGSVLVLADVTNSGYDPAIATRWKAAHLANAPYVRASAVYGLGGIIGVTLRAFVHVLAVMKLSRPNELMLFATRDEALAWLQKQ
jgi:hypothetical protein